MTIQASWRVSHWGDTQKTPFHREGIGTRVVVQGTGGAAAAAAAED